MKLLPYVQQLEGKSREERRELIVKILKKLKYKPRREGYSHLGFGGENLIVRLGKTKKEILIITHYDVVPGSPGANDNTSTIAVMFDMLQKLKKYKPKHTLKFIFFDQEELDCVGSRGYCKKHNMKNIIAVYNMELVGMGDMFGIWPITKDIKDSLAVQILRETITKRGYEFEEAVYLPLFFGDYKAFREAGIQDAICLSVAHKKERKILRRFVEMPAFLALWGVRLGLLKLPTVFKHYHSEEDTSEYLNESALQMTSDVLYHTVKELDKKA